MKAISLLPLSLAAMFAGALVAGGSTKSGANGKDHKHDHKSTQGAVSEHIHAAVPAEYAKQVAPSHIWTDASVIARGAAIHAAKCAVCHGSEGGGDGPAVAGLIMKPVSFRDKAMVAEMTPEYWFWRVSEGGAVEPYKSKGSSMPAYKSDLSAQDRWAVIAFQRPDLFPTLESKRAAILKVLPIYLHHNHRTPDLYADFHEKDTGGHGSHAMDMGPRPPSVHEVLAGTAPPSDQPQPTTKTPARDHKH